jgi:hypothetical protein
MKVFQLGSGGASKKQCCGRGASTPLAVILLCVRENIFIEVIYSRLNRLYHLSLESVPLARQTSPSGTRKEPLTSPVGESLFPSSRQVTTKFPTSGESPLIDPDYCMSCIESNGEKKNLSEN